MAGMFKLEDFNKNEFWFNHIGDAFDTTLLMWGTRGLIEVFDKLRQKIGNEELNPRLKMWTSVLIGMAIPITIETLGLPIGGNTAGSDPLDSFGPLVAGILAGGSWELSNFLGTTENWIEGQKRVELAKKKISELTDSAGMAVGRLGGNIQRGILSHINDADGAMDYLTTEAKIASLMMDEWHKNFVDRLDRITSGDISGEQ